MKIITSHSCTSDVLQLNNHNRKCCIHSAPSAVGAEGVSDVEMMALSQVSFLYDQLRAQEEVCPPTIKLL